MQTKLIRSLSCLLVTAAIAVPQGFVPSQAVTRALAIISADSLRGNLSFIASDLLEGRDTPSRGLDIAALYIAAQFRRAGLQPAGDDGYFQTAKMLRVSPAGEAFDLRLTNGSRTLTISRDQSAVVSQKSLDLSSVSVYKIANPAGLRASAIRGAVVIVDAPPERFRLLAQAAAALQPAAFLETAVDDKGLELPRLIDAAEEHARFGDAPRLIVRDAAAVKILKEAQAGETGITISIKLPAPTAAPVTVRNVAALLPGSDPALRDRYVLLTAHYDHIGRDSSGVVYAGANDDGSGTVSVIEIARALAGARVHPRRSIVFLTFFGEEEGGLGSRYYTGHPLFALAKTVADLNLEQVGRTDSTAGLKTSNATVTGFKYSNIPHTLQRAGVLTGVKVYETPNADEFFDRSDNQTFAEHGIPAHTIVVAFQFPGYHETGDVWPKIDFTNMAKVDRMIALATVMLADNPDPPHWNAANSKVTRYRKARTVR